ncbi:MAG: GNAT family N-acetyltransferase, partial [Muribaculaceae bacterium]|nr:GNAT family N-acetyltransferase [Muribaculaceae bacterium]
PANLGEGCVLVSHQGLTYGGWLTPYAHFDGNDMLSLFEAWLNWCKKTGIKKIIYKAVPYIYHKIPAEEDIYALFRFQAHAKTVNLSSVVDLNNIILFNKLQKRHLKKASRLSPWIRETDNVADFMPILSECLRARHRAVPVHSETELEMLKRRFPKGIRFFLAGVASAPEAAVCIYDTNGVAHCQYIATSESGRENGILTFLLSRLMTEMFAGNRYFDLGTSNEEAGRLLNPGLLHQKYGLGGRGTAYSIFEINV